MCSEDEIVCPVVTGEPGKENSICRHCIDTALIEHVLVRDDTKCDENDSSVIVQKT